jgi:hypothetical protein
MFFFLDKKERKNQEKTICHAKAKLLRVLSGQRAVSKGNYLHKLELLLLVITPTRAKNLLFTYFCNIKFNT